MQTIERGFGLGWMSEYTPERGSCAGLERSYGKGGYAGKPGTWYRDLGAGFRNVLTLRCGELIETARVR